MYQLPCSFSHLDLLQRISEQYKLANNYGQAGETLLLGVDGVDPARGGALCVEAAKVAQVSSHTLRARCLL